MGFCVTENPHALTRYLKSTSFPLAPILMPIFLQYNVLFRVISCEIFKALPSFIFSENLCYFIYLPFPSSWVLTLTPEPLVFKSPPPAPLHPPSLRCWVQYSADICQAMLCCHSVVPQLLKPSPLVIIFPILSSAFSFLSLNSF